MTSWRDVIQVHPAADLFPRMSPEEMRALGKDITKNGVVAPIIMWSTGAGIGSPTREHGRYRLLDGRNRLDAAEMAGLKIEYDLEVGGVYVAGKEVSRTLFKYRTRNGAREKWIDPYEYAVSANVHRRHLTCEQKRELIAKVLKADPEKSNRQIAETVKADHKTVAKVRAEQEARGEVPHVSIRTDTMGREQPAKKAPPSRKEPMETERRAMVQVAKATAAAMLKGSRDGGNDSAVEPAAPSLDDLKRKFRAALGKEWAATPEKIRRRFLQWLDGIGLDDGTPLATPAPSGATTKPSLLASLAQRIADRFGDGEFHPLSNIADALDLDQPKVAAALDQMPDGWSSKLKEYRSGWHTRIWRDSGTEASS